MNRLQVDFEFSKDFYLKAGSPNSMPAGSTYTDVPLFFCTTDALATFIANTAAAFPGLNALLTTNPPNTFSLAPIYNNQQGYGGVLAKDPKGFWQELQPSKKFAATSIVSYIIMVVNSGDSARPAFFPPQNIVSIIFFEL